MECCVGKGWITLQVSIYLVTMGLSCMQHFLLLPTRNLNKHTKEACYILIAAPSTQKVSRSCYLLEHASVLGLLLLKQMCVIAVSIRERSQIIM